MFLRRILSEATTKTFQVSAWVARWDGTRSYPSIGGYTSTLRMMIRSRTRGPTARASEHGIDPRKLVREAVEKRAASPIWLSPSYCTRIARTQMAIRPPAIPRAGDGSPRRHEELVAWVRNRCCARLAGWLNRRDFASELAGYPIVDPEERAVRRQRVRCPRSEWKVARRECRTLRSQATARRRRQVVSHRPISR
jgi:hypothetical protein